MIKQLDKHLASNVNSLNMSQNIMVAHKAIEKINELVDAVNALQSGDKTEPETSTDSYVEQRKWIGKLCRFWDSPDAPKCTGILVKIHNESFYPFVCGAIENTDNRISYRHCEPITADDELIYKGE